MGNQEPTSSDGRLSPIDLDEVLKLCRGQRLDTLPGFFKRYGSANFTARFAPQRTEIEHPDLRFLHEHYATLTQGDDLPLWNEEIPFDLRGLLPNLHVLDFIAKDRMRFRIFGTAVAEYYGYDYTGEAVADKAASLGVVFHALAIVTSEQRTTLYTQHVPPDNSRVFDCQRLFLPFRNKEGEIHRLLVAQYPFRRGPADQKLAEDLTKPVT